MSKPGRLRRALAAKLQAKYPEVRYALRDGLRDVDHVVTLEWLPDNLWPAQGFWRSSGADCYRWEGTVIGVRPDGSRYPWRSVGSYETMTDLLKPGKLRMDSSGYISNKLTTSDEK